MALAGESTRYQLPVHAVVQLGIDQTRIIIYFKSGSKAHKKQWTEDRQEYTYTGWAKLNGASFYSACKLLHCDLIPCGGLSWLPVSFLLHVKYTAVSYRIVS